VRRRRRPYGVWALRTVALLVAFGIGVGLGQALDDSSAPSGNTTFTRQLEPVTLSAETVTVTVTTP
jgi:hypothetical protein